MRCVDEYRVAGTIIGAVGGPVWDPACDLGLLKKTLRPNVYSVRFAKVSQGTYEFKVF